MPNDLSTGGLPLRLEAHQATGHDLEHGHIAVSEDRMAATPETRSAPLPATGLGQVAVLRQWSDHASDLAQWAWTRLVNRRDVWGGYVALADRAKIITRADSTAGPLGATTTRPAKSKRGQIFLTLEILERHYRATASEHVVGLHTTSQANTSRWGAVELDHHGEGSSSAEVNVAAARAWYERLRNLGFHPLMSDSNGKGGFHLLTVFAQPAPSALVFSFLNWLSSDFASHGLCIQPETFPKQRAIDAGRFGNWLRLPGRHHTREHWSRVWDGANWLEGGEAAKFMLTLTGDAPELIPALARTFVPRPSAPSPPAIHRPTKNYLDSRIRTYLAKLPTGLGEGQHRDDFAFKFAAFLVRDLALPEAEVLWWLTEWDVRQAVPKGEARLREILANAKTYGQRPVGCGLLPRQVPRFVSVQVEV